MTTRSHVNTSYLRLMRAKSQAYWTIDHKWPLNVSHAVATINEEWSAQVDAICDEERDGYEEKVRKVILLITRIRRA